MVPLASGFQIVAPNGTVVDAAGVRGAIRGLVSRRGVRYPQHVRRGVQYAFVRRGFVFGHPIDTGNNAANFTFQKVVRHPRKRRK